MDFFDPQKQRRHGIRLAVGYAIIGLVLALATIILLYQAYGYGLDKEGRLIQNGLVFVSSGPEGADVYLNGKKHKDRTNTRLTPPAGQYLLELKRDGYRDWKRILTVLGGKLERFDYPLLVPLKLATTPVKQYEKVPSFSTASPDGRWLIAAPPQQDTFDLFDLNTGEPDAREVAVSGEILAAGSTTRSWRAVEWSKNNRHVLLSRSYEVPGRNAVEYILFDRQEPAESQNLSVAFGFTPDKIELRDKNHDQYYLHDKNSGQLFMATLEDPTPRPLASGVLDFASDRDVVTYVTAEGAPEKEVLVRIQKGTGTPLTVREIPTGPSYVLDLAVYDRVLYLAAGSSGDNRVFLYGDPVGKLRRNPAEPLVPAQILKVAAPVRVSFSPNGRFVAAENEDKFAVYDAETDRGYVYETGAALDKPQQHAAWLDGYRLAYASGGKVVMFDFDGTNFQELSPATAGHLPAIDNDRRYLYTINGGNALTRTALLTPEDL